MTNPHASPGSSDWRDWPAGTRAVVRRRLTPVEAGASGQRWTDVVGVVVAADADGITLRRDPARPDSPGAGEQVRVPAADVEAAKVLPPRPARRPARPRD
ncbi:MULTISPECIES: hypothetical protein [Isoptericola]|uniref:hypothetical protein n=1 Tax=Isoptericola TaxID=254250 RepID=UPI000D068AC8|nr:MULTISPECIES: hypothetical protein [Isoptericola]